MIERVTATITHYTHNIIKLLAPEKCGTLFECLCCCRPYAWGSAMSVFVYTWEVQIVPQDVVRVRVDPYVTSIPAEAFKSRTKLAEVELCEGLVEIGHTSFGYCYRSITKINIPASLRRIGKFAFHNSLRAPIHLHDDIESIGIFAFFRGIFTNFRAHPSSL